jgi:Kdo2-lipid IVA lauroyltransferase/acyltransferase
MGKRSRLLEQLQYPVAKSGVELIRSMPYSIALSIGRYLGLVAWLVDPFHRKVAQIQMRHALGEAYRPDIVRKVFMFHGDILVDAIQYAYMDVEEVRRRVIVEGKENLNEGLASSKGLMGITGHIGNWEILTHMNRVLGIEFCVMADVRKDPRLESLVDGIRKRSGAIILPPKGKALMLIKELKKGHTIAIVADQRGKRSDNLYCNFFGLPAPTNPAPAFLALKSDALIMPVYAVKENGRYRVCFSKIREASSFGDGKEGIANLSQFMQSWLETVVRKHPDQWFWLHCRWTRRSEMRGIIRRGEDFGNFVLTQAHLAPENP